MFSPVRAAIHFPIGVLAALCLDAMASVGWALLLTFVLYEITEDWRIQDHCYIDVIGFLIGLCITTAILLPSHLDWA